MKTVLFAPGFQEDLGSRDYKSTIDTIESRGYRVKFVPIGWTRTTIDDWVERLDKEYAKHDPKSTILAGFSFGAMTAFVTAAKRSPAELWLFSLSPYFTEDMPKIKKSWTNRIGKRRIEAFRKLGFDERAGKIGCNTLIFAGGIEMKRYPSLAERSRIAHKLIPESKLVVIPSTGHNVADPGYIEAIKANI